MRLLVACSTRVQKVLGSNTTTGEPLVGVPSSGGKEDKDALGRHILVPVSGIRSAN